jgi:FeS assembly protein IscX
MAKLTWSDVRAIGELLYETHEDTNPLSLSFVNLHKLVQELPGFDDDPMGSSEKTLEGIQMIWLEEWKFDHE